MSGEQLLNLLGSVLPAAGLLVAAIALWLWVRDAERKFNRARGTFLERQQGPALPAITLQLHTEPQNAQIHALAALVAGFAPALLLRELLGSRQ